MSISQKYYLIRKYIKTSVFYFCYIKRSNANERGVYYNENSTVSQRFSESQVLKEAIKEYEDIVRTQGKYVPQDLHFDKKEGGIVTIPKLDRYSSIQHAKLINAFTDENNRKHARFIDNYDFKRRSDKLKNIPNNHGYSLQEKELLENYYTIIDVLIKENRLDELYYIMKSLKKK